MMNYISSTSSYTSKHMPHFRFLFKHHIFLIDEPSSKHVDPLHDGNKAHKYNPLLPDRKRKKVHMTAKEKKKLRALLKRHAGESDLDDIRTFLN